MRTIFSVFRYQSVRKYKSGPYILYRYHVFLCIIYIFHSITEICIVVETMEDIGPMELFYLFTLSYIRSKDIVLSIFTPRPCSYLQLRIILINECD